MSSPDITLAGCEISKNCNWKVDEPLGNSDHLPILITIDHQTQHQHVLGSEAKWKRKDVDWPAWTSMVEDLCISLPQAHGPCNRVKRFTHILTTAADKLIGKVKPGKNTKCWLTPHVRDGIRTRNQKRKLLGNSEAITERCHQHEDWSESTEDQQDSIRQQVKKEVREEWLQSCGEVQERITQAKEDSWKNLLEDAVTDAKDSSQLWSIIKSLNGSPSSNSPNEAMKHKKKTITSNQKKANIFAKHYASVSRLKFSKMDRINNLRLKKILREASVYDETSSDSCKPFSLDELKAAISQMKTKGACGPDNIPPTFLKALGEHALNELLSIFNESFLNGICPQVWRQAIIIPLLKAFKSASDLASFRPISLTSCIVKTLERMIAERLYYFTESKGLITPLQAGYRKMRGCEDQIARFVQRIEDGFEEQPFHRSVLVLLDFSKAFDTVWREKLLLSLHEMGIPLLYMRWLYQFLRNRFAKVKFNGSLSKNTQFLQGVPQGSVLSPLLFILYMNSLARLLPEGNTYSLYADDVSILATRRTLEEAQAAAQIVVDIVIKWAVKWKLKLNAAKSEVSFFTNYTKEAKWRPSIIIDDKPIKFNPTPKLLGVTLDRQLTFGPHVENINKEATNKLKMLACLSHSKWGWRKNQVVRVYKSHLKSILDYAGFAWQPYLSKTNYRKLEMSETPRSTNRHKAVPEGSCRSKKS